MASRRWEVIQVDELQMRLRGTGLGAGEITLDALTALAQSLQLLATRIGRHLTGQQGPGRSPTAVERATQLRLRGLSAGSTVLAVAIGDEAETPEALEHRIFEGVLDVCAGIASDQPPTWTTPLIGEAAIALIDALSRASTTCEIGDVASRRRLVRFAPDTASRQVWTTPPMSDHRPGVAVSGLLEAVDLRRSRFRIRDAAGNDIRLDEVGNAADTARLVGELVTATGDAALGSRSQIVSLTRAVITPTAQPVWPQPELMGLPGAVAPLPDGIADVTTDEVAEFLAMIRE